MECAQLEITGGGSTQPATVSFPGAYAGTDPGIKINIYQVRRFHDNQFTLLRNPDLCCFSRR